MGRNVKEIPWVRRLERDLSRLKKDVGTLIKDIERAYLRNRSGELDESLAYPKECFAPIGLWSTWLRDKMEHLSVTIPSDKYLNFTLKMVRIATLATWRYQKLCYEFDPGFAKELVRTNLNEKLPASTLCKLPGFCVFASIKGEEIGLVKNFFVYVDATKDENGHTELSLFYLVNYDTNPLVMPLVLTENLNMQDAINRYFSDRGDRAGVKLSEELEENLMRVLVALTLYICAEEPDLTEKDQPVHVERKYPPLERTTKGYRLFEVKKSRVIKVGEQIAKKLSGANTNGGGHPGGDRKVQPHVRKAHWHSFWKGPLKGERECFVKWLPPIFVGDVEDGA